MPDKPPERIWMSPRMVGLYAAPEHMRDPSDTVEYILASRVAAEKEKVWDKAIEIVKDYAKMTVNGFREKYDIKSGNLGWVELVAALEASRTADIKETANEADI